MSKPINEFEGINIPINHRKRITIIEYLNNHNQITINGVTIHYEDFYIDTDTIKFFVEGGFSICAEVNIKEVKVNE